MNREIKFRAWYGGTMAYFTEMDLCNEYHSLSFGSKNIFDVEKLTSTYPKIEEVAIMQFTGLNDKKGKEIYESDIVKLEHWNPKIFQVGFNRGGFCFYQNEQDPYYNDCKYLEECEVIGNIHENPELLK